MAATGGDTYHPFVHRLLDILSMDLVDRAHTSRFVIIQKILSQLSPALDDILQMTISADLKVRCYASILLQGYLMHSDIKVAKQFQDRVLETGFLLWYITCAIDGSDLPDDHPYRTDRKSVV